MVDDNLTTENVATGYLPPETAAESPYLTEIREFSRAFAGGPRPRVDLDDGVMAVAIAEAARESIACGAAVRLDARTVREGALG
jgi:myo-inositol 2-dehydrogenase/D-chiro-inositol 1-dehydrogenase